MQDAASHYNIRQHTHPKTLMRYGLIAWTRVSANSETRKGVTSEWAVRLGQRLQLKFGKSGAARELGLVQIVVEASIIREDFSNTNPHYCSLVLAGTVAAFFRDYGEVLSIRTAGYKLYILETMTCS